MDTALTEAIERRSESRLDFWCLISRPFRPISRTLTPHLAHPDSVYPSAGSLLSARLLIVEDTRPGHSPGTFQSTMQPPPITTCSRRCSQGYEKPDGGNIDTAAEEENRPLPPSGPSPPVWHHFALYFSASLATMAVAHWVGGIFPLVEKVQHCAENEWEVVGSMSRIAIASQLFPLLFGSFMLCTNVSPVSRLLTCQTGRGGTQLFHFQDNRVSRPFPCGSIRGTLKYVPLVLKLAHIAALIRAYRLYAGTDPAKLEAWALAEERSNSMMNSLTGWLFIYWPMVEVAVYFFGTLLGVPTSDKRRQKQKGGGARRKRRRRMRKLADTGGSIEKQEKKWVTVERDHLCQACRVVAEFGELNTGDEVWETA